MSLKRSNSSNSLKRSGSAPNLINTTDKFSPLKRGSSIYDDDDDDWDDDWKTPPNVVYNKSNNINRTPINPIKAYAKAHVGMFKAFGKIGNAFGQFIPSRSGRKSKKKKKKNKKKNNKKTKKKKQGKKKQSSRKKKKKKYKKQGKKNKRKTKRR